MASSEGKDEGSRNKASQLPARFVTDAVVGMSFLDGAAGRRASVSVQNTSKVTLKQLGFELECGTELEQAGEDPHIGPGMHTCIKVNQTCAFEDLHVDLVYKVLGDTDCFLYIRALWETSQIKCGFTYGFMDSWDTNAQFPSDCELQQKTKIGGSKVKLRATKLTPNARLSELALKII